MKELIIRNYLPTDREDCRSLWRELTERHREMYQEPTIGGEHPEDAFDKHLARVGADHLWVAILDSQAVGLIGLIVKEDEAEIEPLIVSQPHRHIGIGKTLVDVSVAEVRKLGAKYLFVRPVARNVDAIKFFYEQGFKNMGHIQLLMDLSNHLQWKKDLMLFDLNFNY